MISETSTESMKELTRNSSDNHISDIFPLSNSLKDEMFAFDFLVSLYEFECSHCNRSDNSICCIQSQIEQSITNMPSSLANLISQFSADVTTSFSVSQSPSWMTDLARCYIHEYKSEYNLYLSITDDVIFQKLRTTCQNKNNDEDEIIEKQEFFPPTNQQWSTFAKQCAVKALIENKDIINVSKHI